MHVRGAAVLDVGFGTGLLARQALKLRHNHADRIAALRKAFQEGIDIHAMTASEMFGVPIEGMPGEVIRPLRRRSRTPLAPRASARTVTVPP